MLGKAAILKSLTPFTSRATVLECTTDPEVPVIVTVLGPVGVAAEVLTVRIELDAPLPGVRDAGLNEQVAPVGSPEQENDMRLLKLLVGCTVTV